MFKANQLFTNEIRQALAKFSIPSSSTLMQASRDLHKLSQSSSFLSSLFYILSNDETVQLRQTAAVVFRRKAVKLWKSYDRNLQTEIRQAVLQCLVNEKESVVQHAIMEIIGSIAKVEYSAEKQWPELTNFIETTIQTNDGDQNECAAELLKIVCETCGEYFEGQYNSLLILIDQSLKSTLPTHASFYLIQAFNSLVPFLGDDQTRYVRPLVPKCIQVVKMLLDNDCESQAYELLELFDSLTETEVSFIASYVKDLIVFLLHIAGDTNMDDDVRTRVLSVLQSIIRLKKKAILKNNLIGAILEVVCPILVSPLDDSNENDEAGLIGESSEVLTPLSSSLQVVDSMALHFPPSELYKKLTPFVETCLASDEPRFKRGLLLTLACVSEGTSEFIKANHMRPFLEVVCRGTLDACSHVRNAALFALGQFSEQLQPDVSEYANEVMPLLFRILQTMTDDKRGSGITKAYYALENFVENLESAVLPYLEKLMQHLLETLKSTSSIHVKELVISAIGAVCNAAQEHLLPFLPEILEHIQNCLSTLNGKDDDGELCILHTQALDTLSVLVRNLGKLRVQLAEDSMKLGMRLVEIADADPDLRRSAYGLFAAVASVAGEDMYPFLSSIVKCIVNSIHSTDGIIPHYNKEESGIDFSFLDDSATDLDGKEEDIDNEFADGFSVENAYMDEKVDAIDAIGDFAKYCGKSFESYLDECLEEVRLANNNSSAENNRPEENLYAVHDFTVELSKESSIIKLNDFPFSDVRKASISTFGQLIIAAHCLGHVFRNDIKVSVFSLLSKIILSDKERLVVMAALTSVKEIIESCGLEAMTNQTEDLKLLMNSIMNIFHQKSACQDDEMTDDDDEQQAEYDEMLLENCGELFPVLADKLKQEFLPNFLVCLPLLLNKLKPTCSTSEKSFISGIISETVEKLGPCCPPVLLKNVIPQFVRLSRDSESEVRNNAIYGLGVLLQNGVEATSYFPIVLSCLSSALSRESSRRVIDNILSSLARMICTNRQFLPLKEILPVFLSHLPIEEDHDEDAVVYGCLATLLRDSDVVEDSACAARIINIFALVLMNREVAADTKLSIQSELKNLKSRNHRGFIELANSNKSNPIVRDLLESL